MTYMLTLSGGIPPSRNFHLSTHVNFMRLNKIQATWEGHG